MLLQLKLRERIKRKYMDKFWFLHQQMNLPNTVCWSWQLEPQRCLGSCGGIWESRVPWHGMHTQCAWDYKGALLILVQDGIGWRNPHPRNTHYHQHKVHGKPYWYTGIVGYKGIYWEWDRIYTDQEFIARLTTWTPGRWSSTGKEHLRRSSLETVAN